MRWVGPDEPGEKARLDSWCAAVGPALIRDEAASIEPRLDEILFASWNMHVGAADVERFVRDVRSGRLSEGRRPPHLVLLLQEAVRVGPSTSLRGVPSPMPEGAAAAGRMGPEDLGSADIGRIARQLNMSVVYVPSMRNGAGSERDAPADRGNAILSTMPLSEPAAIELPGDGQRRVAVTASTTVTVNGQSLPLSVASAHLSTRGSARSLWVFNAMGIRRRQARSLAAALTTGPMILGADLNSWMRGPREPAARDLMQAFPATPGGARDATSSAGLVLDYMFFRPPSNWRPRLVRAPERYGSDHYPLLGWLEAPAAARQSIP